jgi:HlyD family secretion protein
MKGFRIRWYLLLGLVVVAVMGVSALRLLSAEPPNVPRPTDVTKAKRTAAAPAAASDEREAEPPPGSVSGNGVVEPRDRQTNVGAPVAGRIAKVFVTEGQKVNEGDELLELDHAIEEAAVAAARADYAASNAQLLRVVRGNRVQDMEAAAADADAARARAELSKGVAERLSRANAGGAVTADELERATRQAKADDSAAAAAEARAHGVLSKRTLPKRAATKPKRPSTA